VRGPIAALLKGVLASMLETIRFPMIPPTCPAPGGKLLRWVFLWPYAENVLFHLSEATAQVP
jgi:hypothetical protein